MQRPEKPQVFMPEKSGKDFFDGRRAPRTMPTPTRTTNRPIGGAMRRHRRIPRGLFAWVAAAAGSVAALPLGATPADGLPPLARSSSRSFSIPFRLPKGQTPDAEPRRVLLNVSKDLGLTWEESGEASPSAGAFSYLAEIDGEYWFRLRSIDAEGRIRGGLGPDVRVLVNAAGPRIAGRAWKGENGEVVCRFAAVDDTIDLPRVVVEWRSTAEPEWHPVAAAPVLSRESPAHLLGEEFWWAGDRTADLTVRVTVHDASGNRSVKQFPMEPADPGIDQQALAVEIGAPPLPSPEMPSSESGLAAPVSNPGTAADAWAAGAVSAGGWPARPGEWGVDRRAPSSSAPVADTAGRRTADGSLFRAASSRSPGAPPRAAAPDGSGLPVGSTSTYRGRPLRLSRSRSFAWHYALPPDTATARVELWGTLDGGVTWQRFAEDPDGTSPIDVHLEQPALYGFRLEIGPAGSTVGLAPRSGESPDCWLGIDEEPPVVKILRADAERTAEGMSVRIDYESQDPMLVPAGTRLSYAPSAVGPWVCIAEGIDATGSFRWSPDRSVPAEVHLRVESRDAAGNVGLAGSAGPVSLAIERKTGLLEGIVPVPGDDPRSPG